MEFDIPTIVAAASIIINIILFKKLRSLKEDMAVSINIMSPLGLKEYRMRRHRPKRIELKLNKEVNIVGDIKMIGKGNPEIKVNILKLSPKIKSLSRKGLIKCKELFDTDEPKKDLRRYNFYKPYFTITQWTTKILHFNFEITKRETFDADLVVESSAGNYILNLKVNF